MSGGGAAPSLCPGAQWEGVLVLLTHTAHKGPTSCHPLAFWESECVSEDGLSSVTAGACVQVGDLHHHHGFAPAL